MVWTRRLRTALGRPARGLRAWLISGLIGIGATLTAAGCGTNEYQAACQEKLKTVMLQRGVTRAEFVARCERALADRGSGGG